MNDNSVYMRYICVFHRILHVWQNLVKVLSILLNMLRYMVVTQSLPYLVFYQERMNLAAQELCLSNPNLLTNRQLLLEEAWKKVNDKGYQIRKESPEMMKGSRS